MIDRCPGQSIFYTAVQFWFVSPKSTFIYLTGSCVISKILYKQMIIITKKIYILFSKTGLFFNKEHLIWYYSLCIAPLNVSSDDMHVFAVVTLAVFGITLYHTTLLQYAVCILCTVFSVCMEFQKNLQC